MVSPYEANMNGARMARKLAAECLRDALAADPELAFHLIAEHDRHLERAADYEMRAGWYAPRVEQEMAA